MLHFINQCMKLPEYHNFDKEIELNSILASIHNTVLQSAQITYSREKPALKKPVFVVGCPRSGTTVLGRCLGEHSQIASAEESLVLLPLWRIYADLYSVTSITRTAHLAEYVTAEELHEALGTTADKIFLGLLQKQKKSMYLDHTPWYGLIAHFIKVLFPDAKFIHVLRDGRQVVRSLGMSYEKGFLWAGEDFETRTRVWSTTTGLIEDALSYYTDDVITVNYKSLCVSPESVLNEVCSFLDVPYEERLLHPLSEKHASSDSSSFGADSFRRFYTTDGWPVDWTLAERILFKQFADTRSTELFGSDWESKLC